MCFVIGAPLGAGGARPAVIGPPRWCAPLGGRILAIMVWDKRADMVVHEREPYNAEPPPAGLGGAVTPLDAFYVRNHGSVPAADRDPTIVLDGLVARPLDLRPDRLERDYEQHHLEATLQCAGNRRVELAAVRDIPGEDPWRAGATSTARWSGVRLADVLADAGVRAPAAHVAFTGADPSDLADPPQPFGGSIPLAKALAPEVLLATRMNGAPLPLVHGAPVRVVVPGWIGARSVKWLTRIEVRERPSDNFFQAVAYHLLPADADPADGAAGVPLGPIPLNCAIVAPEDGARLAPGPVEVSGYAVAGGDRVVTRVDVTIDGGTTWAQAELVGEADPWAWRRWRCRVDLPPGPAQLAARAWDDTAATQPADPADVWNPKGYVNTSWSRVAVQVG